MYNENFFIVDIFIECYPIILLQLYLLIIVFHSKINVCQIFQYVQNRCFNRFYQLVLLPFANLQMTEILDVT